MPIVNQIDAINVDNDRLFDQKVKLVLRDDDIIEIYGVDEGLEQYAGRLDSRTTGDVDKILALITSIYRVVKQKPFSRRSLSWLSALDHVGLLTMWENSF